MSQLDDRGLSVSTDRAESVVRFEEALELLHGYRGDPIAVIDAAIQNDPGFLMGHALRAGVFVVSTERRGVAELKASVEAGEALLQTGAGTPRERAHIRAARAWLDGDFVRATDLYNRLLAEYPRDALALQVSHLCNFYLGRATWLRDHVSMAIPHYGEGDRTLGYALGMQAFGYEECNEFARAEHAAERALAKNRRDPWAIHAVAHCHEMLGRVARGIEWLESRTSDWAKESFMAAHNWWHLALYYLDLDDTERVLSIYDEHIRAASSEVVLDLVDASSMLWRLHLSSRDVSTRFRELAAVWRRTEEEGYYAFNDAHAVMAYAGAGQKDDVRRVLRRLEHAAEESGSNAIFSREVGLPVCRGLAAFAEGDYSTAVDELYGVRAIAHRFGGSNAQRDFIETTLVEAAFRAKQFALAEGLLQSRLARKPEGRSQRMMLSFHVSGTRRHSPEAARLQ